MISQNEPAKPKVKNKVIWNIVFVLIAVGTIWVVSSQNRSFSMADFWQYICHADGKYIVAAVACMLAYVFFEGLALVFICRVFHCHHSMRDGWCYSATDIYFSAITPSATGGQPACAYLMIKEGVPGIITAVALLVNLMMYTLSIIAIGVVTFLLRPGLFSQFSVLSRVLIIVGCVAQTGLAFFIYLAVKKERIVQAVATVGIRILSKLHLLRHPDRKQAQLQKHMEDYKRYSDILTGHGRMILMVFLFNLLQRICQITVTVFAYLSVGGQWSQFFTVWSMQSYTVLGSNCVPIPGAMGVSDYILIDGFGMLLTAEEAVHLDLLSRSLSFYSCILICGITVFWKYLQLRKKEDK